LVGEGGVVSSDFKIEHSFAHRNFQEKLNKKTERENKEIRRSCYKGNR
jgi:hypothetical protein